MGIDACIDVTFNKPVSDDGIKTMSDYMSFMTGTKVWFERKELCDWDISDNILTVMPYDIGRLHRPGKHMGNWNLHGKIILGCMLLARDVKEVLYYGDSGGVAPVVMTGLIYSEYERSYKEMLAELVKEGKTI